MSQTILRRGQLAVAAIAAALMATPGLVLADEAPSAPAGYTLRLLKPAEGFAMSTALGINDAGTVVGLTRPTDKAQPQQAALWVPDAQSATALPQLDGSQFARAFDIANNGVIVGEAFNSAGNSVPVSWGEGIAQLPSPNPDGLGVAWDVADDGTVLASAHDGTKSMGYLISGGAITPLADPSSQEAPATGWRATSISGSGEYQAGVATLAVPHGDHVHHERLLGIWHEDHVHVFEPEDESLAIDPRGINNQAVVVGGTTANRVSSAARWVRGKHEALASPAIEGMPHTLALAVNDSGVVVGYASKLAGNYTFGGTALAWFGSNVVDLNTLVELPEEVTLLAATDINTSGQIVGAAHTPEGIVGFVLTPKAAPEPPVKPSPQPSTPAPSPTPSATPLLATETPKASPTVSQTRPGLPRTGD